MRDLGLPSLAITILGPLAVATRFSRDGDTTSVILWLLNAGSLTTPLPGDVLLTVAALFIALVTIRAAQVREKRSTWTNVGFSVMATASPDFRAG